MKVKYHLSQMKLYVEEKTADTGGGTTEFTKALDNEKPSTSVNTGTSTLFTVRRLIIGILHQINC